MIENTKIMALVSLILLLLLTACSTPADSLSAESVEAYVEDTLSVETQTNATNTATSDDAAADTLTVAASSAADAASENSPNHENAEDYTLDDTAVTQIALSGDTIAVVGDGVTVNGRSATITAAGTYHLTGSLTDGQIIVDTEDEDTVHLVFNGINISNESTSPIYIANAAETVIMLAAGSENFVTDGATYIFPDPEEDEPNAAVFSKDDLTIFGEGSLTVNAQYNDGIASKDGLIIASGTINVTAVDDGIRGKDYLVIKDGNLTITAQGDGLKSDEDEDTSKGYIAVEGGTIQITSGGDAIQATTDVLITDGEFILNSGGGSAASLAADASAKGIKAAVNVNIDGGTFTIQAADDAVHSNGTITINGGSFTIASGDDGMHADASLEINEGTINIQQSYEGLEANDVIINGGTIDIIASDDGINAAGGNDNSATDAPNGGRRDNFTGSQSSITINGGTITIAAGGSGNGDGLDANGTITISGGDIVIKEPSSYRDYSNIDFDTSISFTGGSVHTVNANGTYTEVTSDSIGMMGGFGGPGGGRPGGGAPPSRP